MSVIRVVADTFMLRGVNEYTGLIGMAMALLIGTGIFYCCKRWGPTSD